jgi:hypothetical protein
MDIRLFRIENLAMILMDEPWRVLQNGFPPTVLNHVGKALHANATRVEGLGEEAYAEEEYKAAMRALMATGVKPSEGL